MACRTWGGGILHVPAPPRRSHPWPQGKYLAGGASADCRSRSAVYGLLRTRRGPWVMAHRSASGIPSVSTRRTGRRMCGGREGAEYIPYPHKSYLYIYGTTMRHGTFCSAAGGRCGLDTTLGRGRGQISTTAIAIGYKDAQSHTPPVWTHVTTCFAVSC